MQKKYSQVLFIGGGILSLAGAVGQIAGISYSPYLFSVGAALIIYIQFLSAFYTNKESVRMQRLKRMGFMSSLLLGLAAYFMFTASNLWVLAVLIYSLTSLFYSYRTEK